MSSGVLLSRLASEGGDGGAHVGVLPVEVGALPLLPAGTAQQEAVCKREGDVGDQDEQQDEGKHRGITEVDARERERKIWVTLDLGWA